MKYAQDEMRISSVYFDGGRMDNFVGVRICWECDCVLWTTVDLDAGEICSKSVIKRWELGDCDDGGNSEYHLTPEVKEDLMARILYEASKSQWEFADDEFYAPKEGEWYVVGDNGEPQSFTLGQYLKGAFYNNQGRVPGKVVMCLRVSG